MSIMDHPVPSTKRLQVPHSDLKDVEAAHQRVEKQRLAEAKKIHPD